MPDRISLAVGPRTATDPDQEVTEFSAGTLKMNLRTGPEVGFTMSAKSPAALVTDGLATDVFVYRNGALFRRCRVLPVAQSWLADGGDEATVTAVGYQRLVENRFIIALAPVTNGVPLFYGVDQGSIIWQLVQHTQAQTGGSLGITAGAITNGQVRDRTEYKVGDSIGALTTDLGNVANGAWWGVDALKVLTSKKFSAFTVRTDPITRGTNARQMSRTPGRTFANAAGSSGDATLTVPAWVTTAGVAADPRGRWEAFDSSHSSVKLQSTVVEYANGLLADSQVPPAVWTIELDPADYFEGSSNYSEGEFVNLVVPPSAVDEIGPPAVSVMAQITEVSIGFDQNGATQVTLAAIEVG